MNLHFGFLLFTFFLQVSLLSLHHINVITQLIIGVHFYILNFFDFIIMIPRASLVGIVLLVDFAPFFCLLFFSFFIYKFDTKKNIFSRRFLAS